MQLSLALNKPKWIQSRDYNEELKDLLTNGATRITEAHRSLLAGACSARYGMKPKYHTGVSKGQTCADQEEPNHPCKPKASRVKRPWEKSTVHDVIIKIPIIEVLVMILESLANKGEESHKY